MKALTLDKVASVTLNCKLSRNVHISSQLPCRPGDVVAVRVLHDKSTYNTVELPSGRLSVLKAGDVLAGALGHRAALEGYAGHCPTSLSVGDELNVLNLGGVLGICDAFNPQVGAPYRCEVLGQVLSFPVVGERRGIAANISQHGQPLSDRLDTGGVPVIVVAGTCMNSGKTAACAQLIRALTRRGLVVAAAKSTGVSLRRDIHAMEDAGAVRTSVFTDFGVVTSCPETAPRVARSQLTTLCATRPDVLVLELGDGLLGAYGVGAILEDVGLRDAFSAVILAAADPVGAWGGVQWLRSRGIETTVVTGPATDNAAGVDAIHDTTGVAAINARQDPSGVCEVVWNTATGEKADVA